MVEKEADQLSAVEHEACEPSKLKDEEGVDVTALLQRLRLGKRTIWGMTLGCFALTTIVAFLLPFRYTSVVSFIPSNSGEANSMASALAGQLSAFGAGDLLGGIKSPADLYAGILRSRSISSKLVNDFHLIDVYKVKKESQAEKVLGSNTSISVDLKSSIVTVEVTDKSPSRARDLANAYMDALRETNGRLALTQSSQRRMFFDEQLAKEKDNLETAEVDLKKTQEQSGLIAPTGQTETEIRTIAETEAQIAARQVQLAALRESATEQNPDVIRLRSEIGNLQDQLAQLQKGSNKQSIVAIPTSKVPELELEYVRKDREVKYHSALFDMLSRQDEAARLDEARDAPVLQVLDPASFPDSKSSPKRTYYMLGGLLCGFFSGCGWVLLSGPLRGFQAALASTKTL